MCDECGCQNHEHSEKSITINKSVTEVNDIIADQINEFLKDKKILCINLMGSPGSGKTTVIEGLCNYIKPEELTVIQGDLESDIDKKRLERKNIQTYQINTHSGCHLNATMINKILLNADLKAKKILIIENVGNLVCPAGVNVGQHMNIVVSSTTEGSDKPKKYPLIFMDANMIIISKFDLSEMVDFKEKQYVDDIKNINIKTKIFKTSSKNIESFKEISHKIKHERQHLIGQKHIH